jgi:lipopolysaccharide transport system permease protein
MTTIQSNEQDTKAIQTGGGQEWDMINKPQTHLFDLNVKEVLHYRDLLWLLVRRDFVSFYKQTIFGPLWFFIQPIFTTITYTIIFGNLAGLSTEGVPKFLFYMAGVTCWNYFADCVNKTSTVFKDNSNVFGKVYFPRLIMPLSIIVSNLIRFGVQVLLFVITLAFFAIKGGSFHITSYALMFPFLIIQMALLGLGIGCIISSLTTKYRDLVFVVSFGVQLLMYATTVVYPLSAVSEKYRLLVELNPMTPVIEIFRLGFLGEGSFSLILYAVTIMETFAIAVLGIIIFNKVERNFIDTI